MIEAIKEKPKSKHTLSEALTDMEFNSIIRDVYEVMLTYSRMRKEYLTKDHPIQIGNVTFWFEVNEVTSESFLKFDASRDSWDVDRVKLDLGRHMHDIYFNTAMS